jgi:hypothetical protein
MWSRWMPGCAVGQDRVICLEAIRLTPQAESEPQTAGLETE